MSTVCIIIYEKPLKNCNTITMETICRNYALFRNLRTLNFVY